VALGEPASVVVLGGKALVGVVTSGSANPSGHLAIVDLASRRSSHLRSRRPADSVVLSPDKAYVAIAIEQARRGGQRRRHPPSAGNLTYFPLKDGVLDCAADGGRPHRPRRRAPEDRSRNISTSAATTSPSSRFRRTTTSPWSISPQRP
jgi:hypothetical protein